MKLMLPTANLFLRRSFYVSAGVIAIVIFGYFMLFHRLADLSLHIWDEARVAVNALEMMKNGDYLVATYSGRPDTWNTKPPLLLWIMSNSLRIFESPELAVRLPSAIAALTTAVILFLFCALYLKDRVAGLVAAFVLLSSGGFVGLHAGRTGDYDALLALWITTYALSYFLWLRSEVKNSVYLGVFTAALSLAMLTKGIAGFIPLPGLLLYTILQGRLGAVLTCRQVYIAASVVLLIGGTYLLAREYHDPGYLKTMLWYDVTGRYLHTIEGHAGSFLFYIDKVPMENFAPWVWWFIAGLPILLFFTEKDRLAVATLSICFVAVFLVVLESAGTELPWYAVPAYPFASLAIGLSVTTVAGLLQGPRLRAIASLGLAGLFATSVFAAVEEHLAFVRKQRHDDDRLMYGMFLRDLRDLRPGLKSYKIIDGGSPEVETPFDYNAPLLFYVQLANLNGLDVEVVQPRSELLVGDEVVTCDDESLAWVRRRYDVALDHAGGGCYLGTLSGALPPAQW